MQECTGPSRTTSPDALGDQLIADLVTADQLGIEINEFLDAMTQGISFSEILEAKTLGIDPRHYLAGRRVLATHTELIDPHPLVRTKTIFYVTARQHGATHEEVTSAFDAGLTPGNYIKMIKMGTSHADAVDAQVNHLNVIDYAIARSECNATHQELIEAHRQGQNLITYLLHRLDDRPHDQAADPNTPACPNAR